MPNREILVVGYGSLLSGYGLLAERRGGASRLIARDVHPVAIQNARRGLAKPSSHGSYLAMDIEPLDRGFPIRASSAADSGGIGGLLLTFDREYAPLIARREEYDPDAFMRLIGLADRAGLPLGEFLMEIASDTNFDLLAYRIALRTMLDYTSPGYIFHPIEIDDGRIAIVAIGSGFDGSGDPKVVSRRFQYKMDRLLSLDESMRTEISGFDRAGQIGYYAECVLGGLHGVDVGDLAQGFDADADWVRDLAAHLGPIAAGERERFLEATSIDAARYGVRFSSQPAPSLAALLKLAGIV
ncbi:MAG TPA: hypothetical protein VNT29_02760 [Candidatus Limnocylindrales bacterium]|nr:hypothetical protein [Candidatus Limnocylindrales bacterium]